jgi:hypothetical protein
MALFVPCSRWRDLTTTCSVVGAVASSQHVWCNQPQGMLKILFYSGTEMQELSVLESPKSVLCQLACRIESLS